MVFFLPNHPIPTSNENLSLNTFNNIAKTTFGLMLLGMTGCATQARPVNVMAPVKTATMTVAPINTTVKAATAAPAKGYHLAASDAKLQGGVSLATTQTGYTGAGYLTGFTADADQAVFTIPNAVPGLYDVRIHFSTPNGTKGYTLVVNGAASSGMFPATGQTWATHDAGKIMLAAGVNTLTVQKGWGYYNIDALDVVPAAPDPLPLPVSATLSDPDATPQARALMRYLVSHYGHTTLSGQHGFGDAQYVQQTTETVPAILGGDFIEYSPTRVAHGSDPKNESEKMIQAAKSGQIVTMLWHWNAPMDLVDSAAHPWWSGFYTAGTTFDLQYALAHPDSQQYKLLLSNMDVIAAQLQKFQAAGVPVLWRPLHEAQGGWFWWGAKGPEPFKQLWHLMYNRFTKIDHLHNLIWVDCSGLDPSWYPGDKYVDVIGADEYPSDMSDPLSGDWETLQHEYGGRKLVALTEFGGVPDLTKMYQYGVRWSYFMSWTGDVEASKIPPAKLTQLYQSKSITNEESLPGRHS
jgi:mannan endo-1,4-beta-mannosidase